MSDCQALLSLSFLPQIPALCGKRCLCDRRMGQHPIHAEAPGVCDGWRSSVMPLDLSPGQVHS